MIKVFLINITLNYYSLGLIVLTENQISFILVYVLYFT